MNMFLALVWALFFYCFLGDVFGRSVQERPDRWPGHKLRIGG